MAGTAGLILAQGQPSDNPMREMMRRMMRGFVPPPGMTPETLPDAESEGARLTARFCVQCHDLPSPRYKTASQWPEVFERMNARMRMMGGGGMMGGGMMSGGGMMGMMGRMETPTPQEAETLLRYLQQYAMVEAKPSELAAGPSEERPIFREVCSRCHALPSPSLHPPEEWLGVVARMQANMQLMDKPRITPQQRDAIVRFLQAASR
jgi:cytochrome c2